LEGQLDTVEPFVQTVMNAPGLIRIDGPKIVSENEPPCPYIGIVNIKQHIKDKNKNSAFFISGSLLG